MACQALHGNPCILEAWAIQLEMVQAHGGSILAEVRLGKYGEQGMRARSESEASRGREKGTRVLLEQNMGWNPPGVGGPLMMQLSGFALPLRETVVVACFLG
jgi:hypothetical protein